MPDRGSFLARWTEGAKPLLLDVPPRARALAEALFVVALVAMGDLRSSIVGSVAFVVIGALLVRPWLAAHGSIVARVGTALAAMLVVALATAPAELPEGRRLGIEVAPVTARTDDPAAPGGVLEIRFVAPGSPASGTLREGDRLYTVDGAPLDARAPVEDLRARVQATGEVTKLGIVRDHRLETIELRVPRLAHDARARAIGELVRHHVLLATAIRAVCVVVWLALLLRGQGRSIATSMGITRDGLALDFIDAVPLAVGAFATSITVGLVVRLVGTALRSSFVERETATRSGVLVELFGGTPILAFVVAMIVTATFEELVFRGFLLPRLRVLTGSWGVAIALSSLAFGAGHLYEGLVAIVQTTALGVFFSLGYLRRRRLLPVVIAHATFNVAVFVMLTVASRAGQLPKP